MKKIFVLCAVVILLLLQTPVYAAEISLSSSNGDVLGVMKDMVVEKPTTGNVVEVLGNADVKAEVSGNVLVVLGDVTVDSKVYGNVVSVLGKITLTDRAEVMGNVTAVGGIDRAGGAKVYGQDVLVNVGFLPKSGAEVASIMIAFTIGYAFFVLFVGLIAISISKERFKNISLGIEYKFGKRLGIGLLIYILSIIFSPIIAITIVGPFVYVILVALAEVVVSIYLGKLILRSLNSGMNAYLEFFTGFAVICLIKVGILLVIPKDDLIVLAICGFVYLMVITFINSLGFGILFDTKFGSKVKLIKNSNGAQNPNEGNAHMETTIDDNNSQDKDNWVDEKEP
jgi:hypothetical protein